eukprot:44796-Prorocentrum_minimum.AAC.1
MLGEFKGSKPDHGKYRPGGLVVSMHPWVPLSPSCEGRGERRGCCKCAANSVQYDTIHTIQRNSSVRYDTYNTIQRNSCVRYDMIHTIQ